jgi:hypothetical protein
MTWPTASLARLAQQGYLSVLSTPAQKQSAQSKNAQWQRKLVNQTPSFLVRYDLLFRQMTQRLIMDGYDFSSLHPHQTLKKLLLMLDTPLSDYELTYLIECRHNVKYGFMDEATSEAQHSLTQLTQFLSNINP